MKFFTREEGLAKTKTPEKPNEVSDAPKTIDIDDTHHHRVESGHYVTLTYFPSLESPSACTLMVLNFDHTILETIDIDLGNALDAFRHPTLYSKELREKLRK